MLTEDFVKRSRALHGEKYKYDKTVYVGYRDKLIITCPKHGDFLQSPDKHLSGRGCPGCKKEKVGNSKRKSQETWVTSARRIHADKYDYSRVDYENRNTKVVIGCNVHGFFEQRAADHLRGHGCQECAGMKGLTTETFIQKSIEKHGDVYCYHLVEYENSSKKVKIMCREHGVFTQIANNHLRGSGCPKCTKHGFTTTDDAYLYSLISECGNFIKIGITNKPASRIKYLNKKTPFLFSVLSMMRLDGYNARERELDIRKRYTSAGLSGFNGCTEWLKYTDELFKEIMGT